MRIAVISVHASPSIQPGGTDAGGMNVYVDETAERMARLGHYVNVFSRTHSVQADEFSDRNYELTHLRVGAPELAKEDLPKIMPEFVDATIQHATQRKKQFDIVASHYWLSGVVGCALAAEWQIPHVTSFHTIASLKKLMRPEEDEPEIRLVNEDTIARNADRVVAWTSGEAAHIASQFRLPVEKVAVITPGVDTDVFCESSSTPGVETKQRIIYVGRLDALKGVDLLIEAFALVIGRGVDAELQIVGGGSADEFHRVLGRISKMRISDRVHLPGVVHQSALPAMYSDADCIVAPSFHETFGLAVLEAAACGTPAIAADVDGLRTIVKHGETGFLIPKRKPELYAEKIVEVLSNCNLRNRMSLAARKRAESFSWESTVRRLLKVYEELIQQPKSA